MKLAEMRKRIKNHERQILQMDAKNFRKRLDEILNGINEAFDEEVNEDGEHENDGDVDYLSEPGKMA